MKPRLKFSRGLWFCSMGRPFVGGMGYTPEQAYDAWLDKMLRMPEDFGACGNVGMGGA